MGFVVLFFYMILVFVMFYDGFIFGVIFDIISILGVFLIIVGVVIFVWCEMVNV